MGPFRVHSRTSRSTFKIEVGTYKDGTKRFEIRHLNDLKIAHPKSMASPVERPKLGRPAAAPSSNPSSPAMSAPDGRQRATEGPELPLPAVSPSTNRLSSSSNPPPSQLTAENKQAAGNEPKPAKIQTRPQRSTRNPNPQYVDAIHWSSVKPWSASQAEIQELNNKIQSSNSAYFY